jgi:hypothetical protein
MRSSLAIMGSRNITVRNNTVSGDLPASSFAMRLYTVGPNQPNANLRFFNNLWSDPGGSMEVFADAPQGQTASFTLSTNLYWNGGQPLPNRATAMVNISADAGRVVGDPRLGGLAGLLAPRWNGAQFADGSTTIRAAFERLAQLYGTPAAGSAALDRALAAEAPRDDLLGNPRPRGAAPDLGAVELQQGAEPPARDQRVYLPLLRS